VLVIINTIDIALFWIIKPKQPLKIYKKWNEEVFGNVGLVKQWWDSYLFQGSRSFVFARKLKALKLDLKKWNEEVFGNVERNKRIFVEDLRAFEALEEGRALGGEELLKKAEVIKELERCTLMEEVSWR
jgi:hypothetical protein